MSLLDSRWRKQLVILRRFITWRKTPPWPGFGSPFNGQTIRLKTIRSLVEAFDPDAFVETGTFLGHTTRFFSGQGVPVYTVEVKPSIYAAAKVRLSFDPDINLIRGTSDEVISRLARERPFERPFAYLDAHWWDHLPLPEEIRTIFGTWDDALVAIDDFHIPDDPGYGFDSFEGRPLSLEMLELPSDALAAYPAGPASAESGTARGTVYIGHGAGRTAIEKLIEAGTLRAARVGSFA